MLHVIVTGVGAAMPSYSRTLLTSKWYIYMYLNGPFFYFHAFSVRVTLFVGICPTLYLINLCCRFLLSIQLVPPPPSSFSPQLQRLVTTSLIALNGTYTRHNLVLLQNFIFFIFKISCVVNMGTFNFQIEFKSQYKVTRKKQSLIMNIFLARVCYCLHIVLYWCQFQSNVALFC